MRIPHSVSGVVLPLGMGVTLFFLAAVCIAESVEPGIPAIGVIIDDLGYRKPEGVEALALPGPVTYAILPHTPFAKSLARHANEQGKEIILHQPMESVRGLALGPGGITAGMDQFQIRELVTDNLAAIPHVCGISNHMGSLLSTREQPVRWMIEALMSMPSSYYFVDSRTTPGSVITSLARRNGVPTIARDVFLDNSLDPNDIRRQFHTLVERAKRTGTALAIGHPHSTTLLVLADELANLTEHGVRLVKVSELLQLREVNRGLTAIQPGSDRVRAVRRPRT